MSLSAPSISADEKAKARSDDQEGPDMPEGEIAERA